MKPQNHPLTFLFLISFLTLFLSKTFSMPQQIYINALSSNPICPYVDPNLSLTDKSGWDIVTYEWKFENGTPATGTGASPSVNWTVEGTFLISLTAYKWDDGSPPPTGSPIDSIKHSLEITIDGSCCSPGTVLPVLSSLVNGRTYDSVYFISQNLTLGSAESITLTGTFLFQGVATGTSGVGGGVSGPKLILADDSEFTVSYGSMRGWCDTMWLGIEVDDEAVVSFDNAYMSDAYEGIYYYSSISDYYYFDITESTFFNNRKGITTIATDFSSGKYLLDNTDFDCDPETMFEPFVYNTGHNSGEEFRMVYGIKFEDDNLVDDSYFSGNTFSNGFVGIDFTSSNNDFSIYDCDFSGNKMAGVVLREADIVDFVEVSSFMIPTDVDTTFEQYFDWINGSYEDLTDTVVYGIYANGAVNDVTITNVDFFQDPSNKDYLFRDFQRVGIFYDHGNGGDLTVTTSEFDGLTRAIHYVEIDDTEITSNFIRDNLYGLYVDHQSGTTSMILNCNNFIRSDHLDNTDTSFGVFVTDGTGMGDIGGVGGMGNPNPAGNGWPVDTSSSTNYPTSLGSPPHVSNWTAADKWYSIIDKSGSAGFTYFRYENEFVGAYDGAVKPVGIIDSVSLSAEELCYTWLNIPFPTRVGLLGLNEGSSTLQIYPNPSNSYFWIDHESIREINLLNLVGKLYFPEFSLGEKRVKVELGNIPSGNYLVKILTKGGNLEYGRIQIE